jgi:leader peptidase (prepilin peptidase)/N-methyltransferase
MELILYALFGLLVGIVVNRAADNLPPPARRSLLDAPHCPYCDHPRGIEQFALLSFVLLRGRCPNCSSPLLLRAPVVEIASALLFGTLWLRFGATPQLVTTSVFSIFLLVICVIDLEHRLILDVTSLPALGLALLASPVTFDRAETINAYMIGGFGALVGLAGGLAMYFFGSFVGVRLLRGRSESGSIIPFGQGDVKLAAFAGALVGVMNVLPMLIITILLGGVGAIIVIAFNLIVRHRYDAAAVMPYGPYFVLATLYFMLR